MVYSLLTGFFRLSFTAADVEGVVAMVREVLAMGCLGRVEF
jgi:hypothetical protein